MQSTTASLEANYAFGLRDGIQFETRVTAAHFDEASNRWTVTTDRGLDTDLGKGRRIKLPRLPTQFTLVRRFVRWAAKRMPEHPVADVAVRTATGLIAAYMCACKLAGWVSFWRTIYDLLGFENDQHLLRDDRFRMEQI